MDKFENAGGILVWLKNMHFANETFCKCLRLDDLVVSLAMSRFQIYPHQRGRKTFCGRYMSFHFISSFLSIFGLVLTHGFYFDSPYGLVKIKHIDLFHNGSLLMYSFISLIISLSDLV